jgi:energy-coupling factor transporter ATP-binding protein EcfA2
MFLDEAEAALRAEWPSPPTMPDGALYPSRMHGRGEAGLPEATAAPAGGKASLWADAGAHTAGEGPRAAPAIVARGLIYRYDPELPAVEGVDLEIPNNAYLGIIGQNGSGKTTLVKHFNGLLRPTHGSVEVFGVNTRDASVGQLAHSVGYVFQNPDHQIFCATTREEIAFGPRNLGLDDDLVRERTADALAAFALEPYADLPPAVLGYGLRRKVSIAAVYAMRPRLLILDEPTAGLDRRSADELMRRVDALHAAGHTIVLVSHDMQLVASHCRLVLVMDEGRVLLQGPPEDVFQQAEALAGASLAPPPIAALAQRLSDLGMPGGVLTVDAFCRAFDLVSEGRP